METSTTRLQRIEKAIRTHMERHQNRGRVTRIVVTWPPEGARGAYCESRFVPWSGHDIEYWDVVTDGVEMPPGYPRYDPER